MTIPKASTTPLISRVDRISPAVRAGILLGWLVAFLAAAIHAGAQSGTAVAAGHAYSAIAANSVPTVRVRTDSIRGQAVILVGPLHIPAATPYNHHFAQAPLPFEWPMSGWLRGFNIEILDSTGRALPREMLHHAGVYNLDRRQLAYPTAERLFAAGRESDPVMLPGNIGIPVSRRQNMLLYYALANPTSRNLNGVTLRMTLLWIAGAGRDVRPVMPMYFDVNPTAGGMSTFDVARGRSEKSAEFVLPAGGHIRYFGGHLHDYGVELRIEDAHTNTVLARLRSQRSRDGRVHSVGRTHFLFKRNGLRLNSHRRYRVVAVYDNPTCAPVSGAMGILVAVFAPDHLSRWPAVDTADSSYQKDLAWIKEVDGGQAVEAHDHGKKHGAVASVAVRKCA